MLGIYTLLASINAFPIMLKFSQFVFGMNSYFKLLPRILISMF